ncbi:hypothetical protein A3J15_01815 [Candidatus Roizmanbacteria bacterium RIFCSPLOWO2_02_FULL_38_10]|uniref:Uncharacterized protein n=1 Tax=Candidatus Roizmanbacteria bacterium RIFCSPLOWO2_02_FULL_38_10 TaxID=1802074 RepID=A0A1F7JKH4_9BACT|nr:MAG: hypothetical protein A3J15_01815 [Candidatus Roizmanbacteria bacterium RIFCSPLOWO2_02_FULL_38_10]
MNTIVTHIYPDLDALSSVWLIHRYLPHWRHADVILIPAGTTWNNEPADGNPNIIHVDTGMGKFDHHQTAEFTCAAKLVLNMLIDKKYISDKKKEGLIRLIDVICEFDHYRESLLESADSDIYEYLLVNIIEGLKSTGVNNNELIKFAETALDAVLQTFLKKIQAEKELINGLIFKSKWGKTLAVETDNEEVSRLAQKQGFSMVIRKNSKGHLRIKLVPNAKNKLNSIYEKVKKVDPQATWFLHASGRMLLNGSAKNPSAIATKISLSEVVKMIKNL